MVKKVLIALVVLAVVGGVAFYAFNAYIYNEKQGDGIVLAERHVSEKDGISFRYPAGYFLTEKSESLSATQSRATFTLVEDTRANRDLLAGSKVEGIPGEFPPAITVEVYSTPESPFEGQSPTGERVQIDGKPASVYTTDGLYAGRAVVITQEGKTYVFSVTWIAADDQITRDFAALLTSVSLD